MNLKNEIISFFSLIEDSEIEIYNEFSLQHELGLYLRNRLSGYNVQFERNVNYFYESKNTIKKEIDISIFSNNDIEKYAIELKYPKNGQYPEQMFSFITDIKFMEELKNLGFTNTYAVVLVKDKLFYQGIKKEGIYQYFRDTKLLNGTIQKPTGKRDKQINISGNYSIAWKDTFKDHKYYCLEI